MTESVGVHEAKTHLSRLIEDVGRGEEVIITRRGEEVARLVASRAPATRQFGIDEGVFELPADFDDPLPDDLLDHLDATLVTGDPVLARYPAATLLV